MVALVQRPDINREIRAIRSRLNQLNQYAESGTGPGRWNTVLDNVMLVIEMKEQYNEIESGLRELEDFEELDEVFAGICDEFHRFRDLTCHIEEPESTVPPEVGERKRKFEGFDITYCKRMMV